MIGDPIPDPHTQARAELSASIDQFFAAGRQVVILDGPRCEPRWKSQKQAPAASQATSEAKAPRDLVRRAREAAKTMTLDEAYRALGVSRTVLHRLAKEEGFLFRRHDKERKRREAARKAKAEQEAKLVALIRANSGKGLSRHCVAKQLGISSHYLVSLAQKNGIDFPRRGARS